MANPFTLRTLRMGAYPVLILFGMVTALWVPWRIVQAGYGTTVDFDWNQATGFHSVFIKRPPLSLLQKALVTPFDQIVVLQAKSHIAFELRKTGWKSAKGTLGLATLGPTPIVTGIEHLNNTNEYFVIDPEETPLMQAAAKAEIEHIKKLLAEGANVNAQDQSGYTALMYASKSADNAAIVAALLSAGAAVNAKDRLGNTALNWATWNGIRLEVVKQLIAGGADVNAKDARGNPVLLSAISSGGDENVAWKATKLLLSAGADISATDSSGETAIVLAERIHRNSIIQLLKEWGRTAHSTT